MKQYEKCIEECDKAFAITRGEQYDYVKLAKVLARKANALLQIGRMDESIETYEAALLEH